MNAVIAATTDVRAYAHIYAALGWAVFPLRPNSKAPATSNGFKSATTNAAEIDRLFPSDALNIGIATTAFWVLDIDGPEGRESLAALEAKHGELPATLEATTRNGGRHLCFQHPEGVRIGCRTGVAPGIDTRGEGGYIAVEPSAVPGDLPGAPGRYSWVDWEPDSGEIPEIAEAPGWLVDLVRSTASQTPRPEAGNDRQGGITEGGRNDHLSRRAYALRKAGAAPDEILTSIRRINSTECQPPLSEQELRTIANGKAGVEPDVIEAEQEPKDPPLRLVSVENLAHAVLTAPQFWIDGILPAKTVTLLGGHGGTGKSTLALTIAAHLALGASWAGLQCRRARVAFVTLEDDADVVRYRLRTICETLGLPMQELGDSLLILDGTDTGAPLVEEVGDHGGKALRATAAMHQLQGMTEAPDVWIVDNASDGFDANENERRMVRKFLRHFLTGLVKKTGGAVLLLVHLPKETAKNGGSESYSGSTAWHNSARSRLSLTKDGDAVKLEHQKSNYGPCIAPLRFTWADGAGVLVHAGTVENEPQNAPQLVSIDGEVFAAIEQAARDGVHVPTATAGARPAAAVLNEILSGAGHRFTRKEINAALIRLEQYGQIRRLEIVTAARHRREVWEPAPNAPNAPNDGFSAISASCASACAECAECAQGVIGGESARNSAQDLAQEADAEATS